MSLVLALAASAPFADLDAIDRAVAQFAAAPAAPVDRRLRLMPCAAPLVLGWHGVRRDSVLVQCPGGWRLFVAVTPGAGDAPAAPVIARGDSVTIAVSGSGFAVSQPGEALDAGAPGAWIRVRRTGLAQANALRARVVRPGLVALELP